MAILTMAILTMAILTVPGRCWSTWGQEVEGYTYYGHTYCAW